MPDLINVVRQHGLEGIVAKRAGIPYHSGERCGDWLKWRANRGQEFVIDGYVPDDDFADSIRDARSVTCPTAPKGKRHPVAANTGASLEECPLS